MLAHIYFPFEKKAASNGSLIIEGYSNANVMDRGKERVDPKGGNYENYKKNPIVLFDHGRDIAFGNMPVGKSLVIEPTDKGIYTKIQISNSKTEKISAVRDLVEEGILKTFSIGFESLKDDKDNSGNRVITAFELIEQSIVPIPMNQDSTFAVLQKRFANNSFGQMFCQEKRLQAKGAVDAAMTHNLIFKCMGSNADKTTLFKRVAKMAQTPADIVHAAMNGDIIPMPPKVLKSFILILKGSEMDKPKMALISVSVPKAKFENQDEACKFVEAQGFKSDKMSETDDAWMFAQAEGDAEKSGVVELGNGMTGFISQAPSDKIEPDQEEQEKSLPLPPMASGTDAVGADENPYLLLAKQTNALLGSLIVEIQKMSAKMDGAGVEKEEPEVEETDGEMSKRLEILTTFQQNINQRLQRMGY
jgi:HK97 family phage prohead protease